MPSILFALLLTVPLVSLPGAQRLGASAPLLSGGHQVYVAGDELVVKTQTSSLVFGIAEKGAILNVTNDLTGQYLKLDPRVTNYLWSVDSFDRIVDSSHSDRFAYSIAQTANSSELTMTWQISGRYNASALVVARDDGFIGMKLNVTNLDPSVEIRRVIFPYIGGIHSMGASSLDDLLSIPEREGYVIKNVTTSVLKDPMIYEYPGTLSMQFLYFYEQDKGGIYLGMHDSQSNYKGLELLNASSSAYSLDWYQYAANIVPGNSYQMGYFVMLEGVVGSDWSAGAQVYKDWATKQWYVSRGLLSQRADVPSWVKGLDFVWGTEEYATNQTTDKVYLTGTPSSQMGNYTSQVRQVLPNASLMLYWTGWNKDGFDSGYPEYYPPRDGTQAFKQAINATHAQGIKVMLYFNGMMVDRTTPTYNKSLPYLTIDPNGAPYLLYYDNGTLVGGIPSPTTSWWVDTMVNVTTAAVRDYGADGVFLDQNTVAPPVLDMSTTHGHAPGGGSWWWQAESNLLETVRADMRHVNPVATLSSENVNEVYIRDIDIFQSYDNRYNFENLYPLGFSAPIFAYVYHGYALQYSTYLFPFGAPGYAEGSFLHGIAESLANGYVPGVSTATAPLSTWWFTNESRSVIQTVVHARQAAKQFLTYGTTPPLPVFQTDSTLYVGSPVYVRNQVAPAIARGQYQLPDGRQEIVLANMAGPGKTESGSFPFGLSPTSSAPLLVTESINENPGKVLLTSGSGPLTVSIPPLSVETLTLEPNADTTVLVASSQQRTSGPLYDLLFSSSSSITGMALGSRERSSSTSVLSLSVSVNEPASSGYLHLVFPANLINVSSIGSTITLDGGASNVTTYRNATTTSVVAEYGRGSHTLTVSAAPAVKTPSSLPTTVALVAFVAFVAVVVSLASFVLLCRRRANRSGF